MREKNYRISSQHNTFILTDFQFYEGTFCGQLGFVLGVMHNENKFFIYRDEQNESSYFLLIFPI